MKTLVIPDIHLKPWIFDEAEKLMRKGAADSAVCLMDIPDDWNMAFQVEQYRKAYDRAIAFAKAFPDTLWCYGNHDISYIWGKLESGYSPYAERTVITKHEELKNALEGVDSLVFDMDKLQYISSAGLRVLLSAQKVMNRQGSMVVRNASDDVKEIFDVTGFSDILTIE